ncbi:hypothetical protein [Bordetella pseudohinzii]|uniref:Uncharacterized protein n=1 Tax=Bordetella pseudohinzii TaxID=1331258 RepID=A0A0J6BZ72_9BORD|nr:hypothetical protein [Bordetella pseudohinzii]ANY16007.1 hypothetical protein BBN53_08930 [Bordetella pseudohinzii]KMM23811.1 hypothetical protein L540_11820 [Bordetella pseudohinzii]KXA75104.1 hypothetical protein AW877_20950 [Bordetella pseudohinzii]KXA75533.1 hypothetical protein AW878_20000 [Bordetella pseudohinzii]CUJ08993.1 Uncharacterised protein [Bordetella pseudohinzii]
MPNPPGAQALFHTELLREARQIADILRYAIQPANEAQARDGQGRNWPVKLLGADWQAGILFWRPRDPAQAALMPGGPQFLSGSLPVELLVSVDDGSHLQFQAGRPIVLNFPDASLSMVSEFPALLRRDSPQDVPA